MALPESFLELEQQFDWTGEGNGKPHNVPEVRTYIAGLLSRANEIVATASEATSADTLTADYRWVRQEVGVGELKDRERVVLNAGEATQVARGTYTPEGSPVSVDQPYLMPDKGARHRFGALVDRAKETGVQAHITHILRREVVLGDVPAEQRMTANTVLHEGASALTSVEFALVRPFAGDEKSGDTLFQTVSVQEPGPYNAALYPRDYIADSQGLMPLRGQEALNRAATVLPEDPAFPMDQSLGLSQIEAFLR